MGQRLDHQTHTGALPMGWGPPLRLALTSALGCGGWLALHRLSGQLPARALEVWESGGQRSSADLPRAVMAALRLAGMGLAGYVAVVAALGLVAVLARHETLLRAIDRASAGLVRRVAAGALSTSVAVAAVMAAPAGATTGPSSPPTMHVVNDAGQAEAGGEPSSVTSPAPTMVLVVTSTHTTEPTAPVSAVSAGTPSTQWTVAPGDHLWGIASETLGAKLGATPSDDAVAAYWTDLIELNRDRLADRSNPDLLFAGQQLLLPPVPGR